jgi:hypothetical protein
MFGTRDDLPDGVSGAINPFSSLMLSSLANRSYPNKQPLFGIYNDLAIAVETRGSNLTTGARSANL